MGFAAGPVCSVNGVQCDRAEGQRWARISNGHGKWIGSAKTRGQLNLFFRDSTGTPYPPITWMNVKTKGIENGQFVSS